MSTRTSDQSAIHMWYCPALGAFRRPLVDLSEAHAPLPERFRWIFLSAFPGTTAPPGWVLRAYYNEADQSLYLSHRTIPEKTAASGQLALLYAPPGSYGNDNAGHVPPKEK